jgi:hypothetical protein
VDTENSRERLALGEALRHQDRTDEPLGRGILARAAHQWAASVHKDQFLGRLHDR